MTAPLACPVCGGALIDSSGSARCQENHSFDYARSGYLNLARAGAGRPRQGDTAAMVEARAAFLAAGHYRPLADAVAVAAVTTGADLLAEVGCGSGYYLDAAARALRERGGAECGVGIDLSKAAAAHAARRHSKLRFVVADVEDGIPLRTAGVDLALSVFAPRPGPELGRVVRPGGEVIAAFAGPAHLRKLRERLGLIEVGERKLERLGERLAPWFEPLSADTVEFEIELGGEDARRLALMGPNAWHGVDTAAVEGGLSDLASVVVARFRRRAAADMG
jgi:23S rRNA (guanine745-N1)-methyltransferase